MKTYSLVFFFQFLLVLNQASKLTPSDSVIRVNRNSTVPKPVTAKIVFKSVDGGRTWQDITEGLPDNSDQKGFIIGGGVATNNGFYVRAGDGLFFNERNSTRLHWSKEIFSDKQIGILPGKTGMLGFRFNDGQILRMINEKDWLPIYPKFQGKDFVTIFETANGTMFIGTNTGLFKLVDGGKTWKTVFSTSKGVRKLVESGGVLMGVTQKGIIRSTDNGDHWNLVTREGDHVMDVQRIDNGFAAIIEFEEKRYRVNTSHDDGVTWQPIDAKLPVYVYSIVEVGENLFCSHQNGISLSSDHGKTWKLLLPSIDDDIFHLSVSGNVIYAMRNLGGC